jgi:cysteine-rich repeat protein
MRNPTGWVVALVLAAACDGTALDNDTAALRIAHHLCGDGIVQADELCDTAIASGPGACPTTCADAVCSRDELIAGGSCLARCHHTPIAAPADDDGCCPPGAHADSDSDCPRGTCEDACGDGSLGPSERCDIGIPAGETGACPTTCPSDGVACTLDVIDQAGTCQAACAYIPVTAPMPGDGCCPDGANGNSDSDCASVCGNLVVETGEECDDGNASPQDGCHQCRLVATAFRFTSLNLRDPHIFVSILGCLDVTNSSVLGLSFNQRLNQTLDADSDGDGVLDLSPTVVFRPLAQSGTSTAVGLHEARCTAPRATTSCSSGASPTFTTAQNGTGVCLAPVPGTTRPTYSPPIAQPSGPCFSTPAQPLTLTLWGATIPLEQARVAATYVGNPASSVASGLISGFLPETVANTVRLPDDLPLVGGLPLSRVLAGGTGACGTANDRDIHNGVAGWWVYLNFTAAQVPWTD